MFPLKMILYRDWTSSLERRTFFYPPKTVRKVVEIFANALIYLVNQGISLFNKAHTYFYPPPLPPRPSQAPLERSNSNVSSATALQEKFEGPLPPQQKEVENHFSQVGGSARIIDGDPDPKTTQVQEPPSSLESSYITP